MPATARQRTEEASDPLLDRCLQTLAGALCAHIQPGTGLEDPEDHAPTPADHYGQTSAALALTLLDGTHSPAAHTALQAWQAVPDDRLGHAPFNRFLLNLLADHLAHSDYGRADLDGIRTSARRCPLSRRYRSNNWSLLARLCELQEASASRRNAVQIRLQALFDRWMTPAGGFIDYPERPAARGQVATPATYHHKALLVAVVAAWYTNDSRWRPRIERLLEWAFCCWDGAGFVGGVGRSTHAIFGEACLLASLILLGAGDASHRGSVQARMLTGLLRRWQQQFRPDGFLQLNPAATGSSPRAGHDEYMHLSVYNAWTAAILAWARHTVATGARPAALSDIRVANAQNAMAEDPEAGIVRAGDPERMLGLIATHGQPPQAFSRARAELRYAGGVPFHLTWRGQPLSPAPSQVPEEALHSHPALAGWTPILRVGGILYGLTDFDSTRIDASGDRITVTLSGRPVQLLRDHSGGLPARLIAAVDWRFLDGRLGRGAALKRHRVHDVHATLMLEMNPATPEISQKLLVSNQRSEAIQLINPCGHALVASFMPENRQLETHIAEQPRRDAEDALLEIPLDSSIPEARGYCLPPITIGPTQDFHSRLKLLWRY